MVWKEGTWYAAKVVALIMFAQVYEISILPRFFIITERTDKVCGYRGPVGSLFPAGDTHNHTLSPDVDPAENFLVFS